jgi:hypothetical protein
MFHAVRPFAGQRTWFGPVPWRFDALPFGGPEGGAWLIDFGTLREYA